MYRPVTMKKIQVVALKEFKDDVVKRLHTLGVVQIIEQKKREEDISPMPADQIILKAASEQLRGINEILNLYEEVKPEPHQSLLKKVFNPYPPREIELGELKEAKKEEIIERAKNILIEVKEEIGERLEDYRAISKEINELDRSKEKLEEIKYLDIELKNIGKGSRVYAFVGRCPEEAVERIIHNLEAITSGFYYFDKVDIGIEDRDKDKGREKGKEYACIVAVLNEHAEEVLTKLRRAGLERIEIEGDEFEKKPAEEITAIEQKRKEKERDRAELKKILRENAEKREEELFTLRELLSAIDARANIQRNFVETERVFSLTGWVPAENAAEVAREVDKVSEGLCEVTAVSPEPEEVEKGNVPVLLKNPRFFKSFELFTKLYGIPKYGGIDPTIIFAFTFIFFTAFMLADAIYGLMTALLGFMLFRGIGRYNEKVKDFSIVLIAFGLTSSVIGALTGGWLGDLITARHLDIEVLQTIIIADQFGYVLLFLVFSLLIGILHMDTAILMRMYEDRKSLKDFIGGDLWVLTAQVGLIPLMMNYMSYGMWYRDDIPSLIGVGLLTISFAFLLYAKRKMMMFAITGFLSDTLSYARLMALGISTYGIALAVNLLTAMSLELPYIGIIAAALIFTIGHLANWILQVLGSFVHGLRLHYMEFFSKFYKVGDYGEEYKPFEMKI